MLNARKKLIEKGAEMLVRIHSTGISTTEISKEVGVSQPLLYIYFTNKANFWREVVRYLRLNRPEDAERVHTREMLCERGLREWN